jgi:regulator of replication initiation timing
MHAGLAANRIYSDRTMNRCLRTWGLNRNVRLSESTETLRKEITNHFWGSKTDEEISEQLRQSLAIEITSLLSKSSLIDRPRQVRYVRNMEGLKRTTKLTDEELNEIILTQKNSFGVQGIRKTAQHLKDVCQVWASRGRVQKTLHRLDPSYGRKPYPLWKKRGTAASPAGSTITIQSFAQNDNLSPQTSNDVEMYISNGVERSPAESGGGGYSDQRGLLTNDGPHLPGEEHFPENRFRGGDIERLFAENKRLQEEAQTLLDENGYLQQENAKLVEDNRSLRGEVEGLTTNNRFLRAENEKLSKRTTSSVTRPAMHY